MFFKNLPYRASFYRIMFRHLFTVALLASINLPATVIVIVHIKFFFKCVEPCSEKLNTKRPY
jgi:hypothetical protein